MSNVTLQEAKDGLNSVGMWMDLRYNHGASVGTPIQTWDMLAKEREFFTVYAMNLMLESDGFDSLIGQQPQDVEAFVGLLRRLGAKKTSDFVQSTLATIRSKASCDKNDCTSKYYELFESEQVWLKLLDHLGRRIYMGYVNRAEAIHSAGQNVFDAKQWRGDLPYIRWWEVWK